MCVCVCARVSVSACVKIRSGVGEGVGGGGSIPHFRYSTGYVCYAKFSLDRFLTFRVTSTPLSFCVLRDLKFSLIHNFKQQFNTKSQMISAPKLVPFVHYKS